MARRPITFVDLPTEIRLIIYESLPEPVMIRMSLNHSSLLKRWEYYPWRSTAPAWYWHKMACSMSILRASRRIHDEARPTILRYLEGPPKQPFFLFSSHGYPILEIMFELKGNEACCKKHAVRPVKKMLRTYAQSPLKAEASKQSSIHIEYVPDSVNDRTAEEIRDLGEDLGILELMGESSLPISISILESNLVPGFSDLLISNVRQWTRSHFGMLPKNSLGDPLCTLSKRVLDVYVSRRSVPRGAGNWANYTWAEYENYMDFAQSVFKVFIMLMVVFWVTSLFQNDAKGIMESDF